MVGPDAHRNPPFLQPRRFRVGIEGLSSLESGPSREFGRTQCSKHSRRLAPVPAREGFSVCVKWAGPKAGPFQGRQATEGGIFIQLMTSGHKRIRPERAQNEGSTGPKGL